MAGLIFGIADFAATLGVREMVENQNMNFLYAKQAMVIAAKAAGLHAIDNVYLKLARKDDTPERSRGDRGRPAREERRRREPRHGRHLGDPPAAGDDLQRVLHAQRASRSPTRSASPSSTTSVAAARWPIPRPAR